MCVSGRIALVDLWSTWRYRPGAARRAVHCHCFFTAARLTRARSRPTLVRRLTERPQGTEAKQMQTDEAARQMPAEDPEYMQVRQQEEQMEEAEEAKLEANPPPPADDPPSPPPAAPDASA